jgi:homoserine dehydrogenase
MEKIKLGIIGMGNIGNVHANNIIGGKCPEIELAAACDLKPEKIEKMKAQFEKKNSAEKKPTATQIANEGIKSVILETLGEKSMTVSEMQKANSELAEFQNQKISALLKQLMESGSVVREEIKRKAYFKKA